MVLTNRIMLYHDYFAQTIPKHIDRESTALIKIFAYCQRQKYGPFKHVHKLVHFLQIVHQCQLRKNITRLLSKYLSTIVLHKSQTCLYGSKWNFCKKDQRHSREKLQKLMKMDTSVTFSCTVTAGVKTRWYHEQCQRKFFFWKPAGVILKQRLSQPCQVGAYTETTRCACIEIRVSSYKYV